MKVGTSRSVLIPIHSNLFERKSWAAGSFYLSISLFKYSSSLLFSLVARLPAEFLGPTRLGIPLDSSSRVLGFFSSS